MNIFGREPTASIPSRVGGRSLVVGALAWIFGAPRGRFTGLYFYLRTAAAVLAIWLAAATWVDKPYILPSPITVLAKAWDKLIDRSAIVALGASAQHLLIAYIAAAIVGIAIGMSIGLSRLVGDLLYGVIEIFRPVSGIALIPVLLVIIGISDLVSIAVIFYATVVPFILNTASGITNIEPRLIAAARTLGVSRWGLVASVILPAAMPSILTGARLAASTGWMALIAAELIGAPRGLGFEIGQAQQLGDSTAMFVWILYVGVAGYIVDFLLRTLQRRLAPWDTEGRV